MKLADMVALARAGYKMKDIQALEEKEEQEAKEQETKENTPKETTTEQKPDDLKENETPESATDELEELKKKIADFEQEKDDLKKQLEEAQKIIRSRDLSGGESAETLDDIIRDFCKD